jgi:hypothetical protein
VLILLRVFYKILGVIEELLMRKKIYDAWMYMLIAIATGIVLVLPISLDTWRNALVLLAITFIIIYLLTNKIYRHEINRFLNLYLVFLAFCIGLEMFRASSMYNYSIYESFYALRQYVWIFLALPFYYIYIKTGDIDKTLEKTIDVIMISLKIRAITWAAKAFLHINLFPELLYEYGNSWARNGVQRIDATPLISIAIAGLYYLYTSKRRRKFLFQLLFVGLYLLVVAQTRMLLIGYISCLAGMILFKRRASAKGLLLITSTVVLSLMAISLGAIDAGLNYLGLSSGIQGFGFRYYEYLYFQTLLEGDAWKLGLGILSSANIMGKRILFGNLDTQMYLDDLGILESFVQFGVLSIFMYMFLFLYMIFTIRKCNKNKQYNYSMLVVGLFCYILVVSVPLNLFGIQRSFSISIILAIVCYVNKIVTFDDKSSFIKRRPLVGSSKDKIWNKKYFNEING